MALSMESSGHGSPGPLPPAVPGETGGLAHSSTRSWGGGEAHGCSSCSTNTPTQGGQEGQGHTSDVLSCVAMFWGFFNSYFFSPLILEQHPRSSLWLQPGNWVCHQPPQRAAWDHQHHPRAGGLWWGPHGQGMPAGLGWSWAPQAENTELDFIIRSNTWWAWGVSKQLPGVSSTLSPPVPTMWVLLQLMKCPFPPLLGGNFLQYPQSKHSPPSP